jgi:glycosyltransferase involved in cell wall biosynthesis
MQHRQSAALESTPSRVTRTTQSVIVGPSKGHADSSPSQANSDRLVAPYRAGSLPARELARTRKIAARFACGRFSTATFLWPRPKKSLARKSCSLILDQENTPEMWNEWNSKHSNFLAYKDVATHLVYGVPSDAPPPISIMIPTYKRTALLRQALDSALAQEDLGSKVEIAVVDNDPDVTRETDALMQVYARRHGNVLYYRNQKNIGSHANWNRCIELCRTSWLCLLHDDDMLARHYLSSIIPVLAKDGLALVGSYPKILDDRSAAARRAPAADDVLVDALLWLRRRRPIPITLADNLHRIHVFSGATTINRPIAIEIGGFDERYYPIGDSVFFAKVACYYNTLFIPAKLNYYRIGGNLSLSADTCIQVVENIFRMTEAMVDSLYHGRKHTQLPYVNAILQEASYRTFNSTVDYDSLWRRLNMYGRYRNRVFKWLVVLGYKLRWAALFLRRPA